MLQKSRYLVVGIALGVVALALAGYLLLRPRPANTIGPVLTENGYVELRPPSNLIAPGAWVQVLGSDPLRLSIICEANEALGLADPAQWATSGSSAMTFEAKLAPKFTLDAGTLSGLKASAEFAPVRNVTFRLSNVKLVELPDDVVFKNFKKRTAECDQAIGFRLKQKKNPVSMIKSALIADVEYLVDFDGHIDAQAKAKAISDLALEFGAKLDSSDTMKERLVGQGLVWGVRDDTVLASFGYNLPSTGGPPAQRSVLAGHGPIVAAERRSLARRAFPDKRSLAAYDVHPIKQATPMACWATVYAMLKSWKEGRDLTVAQAVATLGDGYIDQLVRDQGLVGGAELTFVRAASMVAEPPANYLLWAWVEMLRTDGPLWVTLGDGLTSHALILVGIYGSSTDESQKSYDDATFEFIDPMTGGYLYEPGIDFMQRFEHEASVIVLSGAANVELRWQIIHWPSNPLSVSHELQQTLSSQ